MIYLVCSLLLQVRTIKVTNIPLSATAENMKEFFSFSGEIKYVEMRRSAPCSISSSLLHSFLLLPAIASFSSVLKISLQGLGDVSGSLCHLQGVPWSGHCSAPLRMSIDLSIPNSPFFSNFSWFQITVLEMPSCSSRDQACVAMFL